MRAISQAQIRGESANVPRVRAVIVGETQDRKVPAKGIDERPGQVGEDSDGICHVDLTNPRPARFLADFPANADALDRLRANYDLWLSPVDVSCALPHDIGPLPGNPHVLDSVLLDDMLPSIVNDHDADCGVRHSRLLQTSTGKSPVAHSFSFGDPACTRLLAGGRSQSIQARRGVRRADGTVFSSGLGLWRAPARSCTDGLTMIRKMQEILSDSLEADLSPFAIPPITPFRLSFDPVTGAIHPAGPVITRRISDLERVFANVAEWERQVENGDPVVYTVASSPVPEIRHELPQSITTIYPGDCGGEFYMTKGHQHVDLQAEMYLGLAGVGGLLLSDGKRSQWIDMGPGVIGYIPPGWAHRSVNVGNEPYRFLAAYPGSAGHDYQWVLERGMGLRVVRDRDGHQLVPSDRPGAGATC